MSRRWFLIGELAERYENELSEEEYENPRSSVHSIYPDVDVSLEEVLENAKRKRSCWKKTV